MLLRTRSFLLPKIFFKTEPIIFHSKRSTPQVCRKAHPGAISIFFRSRYEMTFAFLTLSLRLFMPFWLLYPVDNIILSQRRIFPRPRLLRCNPGISDIEYNHSTPCGGARSYRWAGTEAAQKKWADRSG